MKTITNISNFEAAKPTKTYAAILAAKKYFKKRLQKAAPIMDLEDQIIFSEAENGLELIEKIEQCFLRGE